MSGEGNILFDYGITALLWLAALMHLVVVRDRSIRESRFMDSCRWLVIAGLTGLALRFSFVLVDVGDINLSPVGMASLGILSVGLIGKPLELLMAPHYKRRSADWGDSMVAGKDVGA